MNITHIVKNTFLHHQMKVVVGRWLCDYLSIEVRKTRDRKKWFVFLLFLREYMVLKTGLSNTYKHFCQSYGQENNHYNSKYEMVKLKCLNHCILKKDLILYTGNVMPTHFFLPCDIHFSVLSQEKVLCSMKNIFKWQPLYVDIKLLETGRREKRKSQLHRTTVQIKSQIDTNILTHGRYSIRTW